MVRDSAWTRDPGARVDPVPEYRVGIAVRGDGPDFR